jgi:hypothetical protein
MKTFLSLGFAAALLGATATLVACGGGSGDEGGLLDNSNMATAVPLAGDSGVSEQDLEGSPCTDPGTYVVCHDAAVVIDGFKYCDGMRSCDPDTGTWGKCVSTLVISGGDAG